MSARAQSAERECPMHSKPAKKDSADQQCCKTLRAIGSAVVKNVAGAQHVVGTVAYSDAVVLSLQARNQCALFAVDTGPPRARSFAELILQRSILAHAPPVTA